MTIADILCLRQQNQHLLEQKAARPEDVVRTLGAVQAQDYAGAKWAVAQRTNNLTSAEFDATFAKGTILRTHVLRPTWHFVLPKDIRWMLALTAPRIKAASQYYWHKVGLSDDILCRAADILRQSLAGKQLTRLEIAALLKSEGVDTSEGRLPHILMFAELEAIICSDGLSGKQHTYALLDERAPAVKPLSRDEALATLAQQFFTGHGPATLQDFTWWSGLTGKDAAHGLRAVQHKLKHADVADQTYWFVPAEPPAHTSTVHLLPNYDEYVVAYTDRTALFDQLHTRHLDSRQNPLFNHTVIVDGVIAGTWQAATVKQHTTIMLKLFQELTALQEQSLAQVIKRYGVFVGRPVRLMQTVA